MDLESIRPSESPRIIDLVAEVGIDTSGWQTNSDGTPCETPASNPKYCYEWCYREFAKKRLLINLWFDETKEEDGRLIQRLNMSRIASNDPDSNRRRRAMAMDSAFRVANLGGWTIRAMILGRNVDSEGKSSAATRLLDPNEWQIQNYDDETGECVLVRIDSKLSVSETTANKWTQEELLASVEAYVEMRNKQTAGEPFVKKEVYRRLAERYDRTEKSFEFRMQNISHVLAQQGREWIKGLRPARNVGANVTREIELLLAQVEERSPTYVATFNTQVEALRKKQSLSPPSGNKSPAKSETPSTSYKRAPEVVAWVLNEAGERCELCNDRSPFVKDDGSPYLEVHHVVRLADNGPDTVDNAAALCPNCHRALHHAANKLELRESLYGKISRLRKP